MRRFHGKDAGWFYSAVTAALFIMMFSTIGWASDQRRLWQSRDQFVALESQDSSSSMKSAPNQHPFDISSDRLTALLASLEVRTPDSKGIQPLFTTSALETLVPELQSGLSKAKPAEDVTFAVIGLHTALFGFAKTPKVTTGRMFVSDGRINIIFGMVQKDFSERDDRRLSPFTPGTRQSVASGDWTIMPQNGQDMTLVRRDWVAFGQAWKPTVTKAAAPAAQAEPSATIPARQIQQSSDNRKPADRLTTLNELKEKGLISEEEYRTKRLEILNAL